VETLAFLAAIAVLLAAFLLGIGLDADSLPFPPEAAFSDAVTSHWANALFLRRAVLEDHAWPLWRPLIMSGQPFAANPLNKVWYPPQWLVLLLPPTPHLNLLTWLHLIVAGAGAWAWSRATGLTAWPAALVGLGYALGPRIIASVGAGHLDLVYAAAWFPWVLWAVARLTADPPARRAEWALAGVAALCFLADVRLSAYAFVMAGATLVWRWAQAPRLNTRRCAARVMVAALLAAALTAFQWVPLFLLRADLSRNEITLDDAAADSLTPGRWLGLLIGDHGGSWETLVYVGISVLALAVVALLMRPRALALWGAALLVIGLYAMGDHFVFWTALNRLIPALRWWRVPPRVWWVAALILPYLAGWGAQLLAESPPDRKIARLSVVALLGGSAVCGVGSALILSGTLDSGVIVGLFALPATALAMLLAILRRLPARAVAILFTVIVVADVLWIDRTLIEGRSRRAWLAPYRELAEYLDTAGATRVYSPSYSLPQQAAAYWEIPQFDGVDPFQLESYVQAFEAATGVQMRGYSVTLPAFRRDETAGDQTEADVVSTANRDAPINPELLGQWLVTHVVSAFEIDAAGLELDARVGDVYVYRNTFAPVVTLTWDGPNRVTVQAAAPVTGALYAVANGRWRNADDHSPGLPGAVDGSAQTWTYQYDRSELWLSLVAAGGLIALAGGVWWVAIRD
jgi:hypothetical protein